MFTEKRPEEIEAVRHGGLGQFYVGERGEAGGEVNGADHFIGHLRLDLARPIGDERRPRSAFKNTIFSAAKGTVWRVVAHLLKLSLIHISEPTRPY